MDDDQTAKCRLLQQLYNRWNRWLVQYLSARLSTKDHAEDLAHEVYLRLLQSNSIDSIRYPRAYLARTALHIMEDWRRRAAQSKPHSSDDIENILANDDIENLVDIENLHDQLNKILLAMPATWRSVLVMHYQKKLTYGEIAQCLGISHRMVKRYLGNAYAQLRCDLMGFETKQTEPSKELEE